MPAAVNFLVADEAARTPPRPPEMDRLRERAICAHCDVMLELVDYIIEHSAAAQDAVEDLKDGKLMLDALLRDDGKRKEAVETWVENMAEPLNPKKVRYCKALDRIHKCESAGTVYHAVVYRDLAAMYASSTSEALARLALLVHTDGWPDDRLQSMWELIGELNRTAYLALAQTPPSVPEPEALAANIRQHKRSSAAAGGEGKGHALHRAVYTTFQALADARVEPERAASADVMADAEVDAMKAELVARLKATPSLSERVDAKDATVLAELGAALPKLRLAEPQPPFDDRQWTLLSQCVSLSRVDDFLPSSLMNQVEGFAHQLAGDVMSGRRNMASLADIESMSEEIMSKFDMGEVDKLAENADNLLPMLQSLQKNLGGMGAAFANSMPRNPP